MSIIMALNNESTCHPTEKTESILGDTHVGGRYIPSPVSLSQSSRPNSAPRPGCHRRLKKANSIERSSDIDDIKPAPTVGVKLTEIKLNRSPQISPRHTTVQSPRDHAVIKNVKDRSPRNKPRYIDTGNRSPRDIGFPNNTSSSNSKSKSERVGFGSFNKTGLEQVSFPPNFRPRRGSKDDLDLAFRPFLNRQPHAIIRGGRERPNSGLFSPSVMRRRLPSDMSIAGLPSLNSGSISRSPSVSPRSPKVFLKPLKASPRNNKDHPQVNESIQTENPTITQMENSTGVYIDYCIKTISPQLERKATKKFIPEGSNIFQKVLDDLHDDETLTSSESGKENRLERCVKSSPGGDSGEHKNKTHHVHFSDEIEINGRVVKSPETSPDISRKGAVIK